MPNCTFCGRTITRGTGIMLVKNSGKIFYFDTSKCKKNLEMGRNKRKLKWAQQFT